MSKDKIYRTVGVLFIISSFLILILVSDVSKLGAIVLGFLMGIGFGLLTSGENVLSFWKSIYLK